MKQETPLLWRNLVIYSLENSWGWTFCLLLGTFCSLFGSFCSLRFAHCLLFFARCLCSPFYLVDAFFFFSFLVLLKKLRTQDEFKISSCCFCVFCESGELGGKGSSWFSCVNPVVKSFSSDLLQAVISHWTESHLEFCQTLTMELSCKNNQGL